jgi:hypothetical protein
MSTGDEPQLGGRGDDNAPMISSVLTRVIVSARGAYAVGNLDALIRFMTDDQKTHFTQIIVRQALNAVERIMSPEVMGSLIIDCQH